MSIAFGSTAFWKGKRVFLTAPTSFLGAWTALSLRHLGAQVFGFAEGPALTPNLFELTNLAQSISMTYGDLRDESAFRQVLQFAEADIVLHLGEFGLLREADKKPMETISKSVLSTALLMELLRETASIRSVVVVSSDKVYERNSDNRPYTEEAKVAAQDILPTAKLCSELIALSYRHTFLNPDKYNKHKIAMATARLGAGVGGGEFSESSLIPQAVQSFLKRTPLEVRNPHSVRPWIHVLDQVAGLLSLAEALYVKGPKLAETYNLGATEYESVSKVLGDFTQAWGWSQPARTPDSGGTSSLHGRLNSDLALKDLGWKPQWDLAKTLQQTAQWYRDYYEGKGPQSLDRDVREFFG